MPEQLEGSQAVARTVARCRPQVVCAYPITPQTHIVEALAAMVRDGSLPGCEFVNVESEFAALSVSIGAAAAAARTYTATASQGLLFMAEALYNAAGLGLPIVMTVANRAIGAPINIWNDQSDSMSQRDCGWVQLYAADNQQAVDLHAQAFRLAEAVSLPVMVCMDGFVLTHAVEPVELPTEEQLAQFLPAYRPRQTLDPDRPVSIGALVGPEAFTEVRYLAHQALGSAAETFAAGAELYAAVTGRGPIAAVQPYRTEGAATVVIGLGSVVGTLQDVADERRQHGEPVGVAGITLYRPFPTEQVRAAIGTADRVIVVERALSPGAAGPVTADVRAALGPVELLTVVAGLGGRAITRRSLHALLDRARGGSLEPLTFLDLDQGAIAAATGGAR